MQYLVNGEQINKVDLDLDLTFDQVQINRVCGLMSVTTHDVCDHRPL